MSEWRNGEIIWQDLTVENAETIRDFYCNVIGFTWKGEDMGGYEDYHMIAPNGEQSVTGVCHARGTNANVPPQWLTYFTVEDAVLAAERTERAGGKVLDGPRPMGGGTFVVIQDPAGAVCALIDNKEIEE